MKKLIAYIVFCHIFCSLNAQSFTGTGGALKDVASTCFSLAVKGVGTINSTHGLSKVCIDISHSLDTDLEIVLQAPDGTKVPLSLQNGKDGGNYTNTCFSAEAIRHIVNAEAPYTGVYNPQGYLGSINNGQNANGSWQLCIKDIKSGDTGKLNSWSIEFSNTPAPPLPPCYNQQIAGNTCQASLPICNFNGYCGNTNKAVFTSNSWAELNAIFCSTINNNSFISFVASDITQSYKLFVTKSEQGGGLQVLFFSGSCSTGLLESHGCYDRIPPASGYTLITATGLVPGQQYFLMLDGYAGDDCEYTILAAEQKDYLTVSPH